MDETDPGMEPVVTSTDGITLHKRLDGGEFEQPTVLYELDSGRETAVEVSVIEPIPTGLEPDDLGFLGSHDRPPWEINGPKLILERTLDPGETVRTGVAARGDRAGAIAELLDTPEFLEVDEPRDGGGGSDVTLGEPSHGPLVERLVAELREGAVPAETVAALRAELGGGPRERPSLETRVVQLQADVADVRAYANAMERFLDDHGPPEEVIEGLNGRLDDIDDRLSAVEGDVEATDRAITDVEERVESLEGAVDRLADRAPSPDVEERLETVEAEIADVSEFTTSLKAAFRQ